MDNTLTFCPFYPLPAIIPFPDPGPLPILLAFLVERFGDSIVFRVFKPLDVDLILGLELVELLLNLFVTRLVIG